MHHDMNSESDFDFGVPLSPSAGLFGEGLPSEQQLGAESMVNEEPSALRSPLSRIDPVEFVEIAALSRASASWTHSSSDELERPALRRQDHSPRLVQSHSRHTLSRRLYSSNQNSPSSPRRITGVRRAHSAMAGMTQEAESDSMEPIDTVSSIEQDGSAVFEMQIYQRMHSASQEVTEGLRSDIDRAPNRNRKRKELVAESADESGSVASASDPVDNPPKKRKTSTDEVQKFPIPNYPTVQIQHRNQQAARDAARLRSQRKAANWSSPANDSSIPQTELDRQEEVRKLLGAMFDISFAKDEKLQSKWADDANDKHDPLDVEAACWEIVVSVLCSYNILCSY